MAGVLQRDEPASRTVPATEAGRDWARARAFLLTGLAWASVVVLSWLIWWLIGDGGREALARTVGLSAAQLAPYVVAALIVEKLAAKALLFAALYHGLKGR